MLSEVRVIARSVLAITETPQRRLFDRALFRVTTRAIGSMPVMVTSAIAHAIVVASVGFLAVSSDLEAIDN
jgi:hypothetical protein